MENECSEHPAKKKFKGNVTQIVWNNYYLNLFDLTLICLLINSKYWLKFNTNPLNVDLIDWNWSAGQRRTLINFWNYVLPLHTLWTITKMFIGIFLISLTNAAIIDLFNSWFFHTKIDDFCCLLLKSSKFFDICW